MSGFDVVDAINALSKGGLLHWQRRLCTLCGLLAGAACAQQQQQQRLQRQHACALPIILLLAAAYRGLTRWWTAPQ